MIGFAFYSPLVINLLLERDRFFPFLMSDSISDDVLKDFLRNPIVGRQKVVLVAGESVFRRIKSKPELTGCKIILFDTVDILEQCKIPPLDYYYDNNVPVAKNVSIFEINTALATSDSFKYDSSEVVNQDTSQFKKCLTLVLNQIKDPSLKSFFAIYSIDLLLGIISSREFNKAKKKIQGVVNEDSLKDLLAFVTDDKADSAAKKLFNAFGDVCVYKTSSEQAAHDFDANLEDLQFLIKTYPSVEDLYDLKKIPKVVELRSKN